MTFGLPDVTGVIGKIEQIEEEDLPIIRIVSTSKIAQPRQAQEAIDVAGFPMPNRWGLGATVLPPNSNMRHQWCGLMPGKRQRNEKNHVPEASFFTKADDGGIGDFHEIRPALTQELKKKPD